MTSFTRRETLATKIRTRPAPVGFCVYCSNEVRDVEPTLHSASCPTCGQKTVYGLDALLSEIERGAARRLA